MKVVMKTLFTLLFALLCTLHAQDSTRKKIGFDPTADPAKDLKSAIQQATKEKKNILLDVGGEWCIWCHRLHEFIEADKALTDVIKKNFVVVKVNVSKENKNEEFLKAYPKVPGYPHMFVLDKKGKLLHSQDTAELEKEKSYDAGKLMAFFAKWKPKK